MKEERTFVHQDVNYRYLYWPSCKTGGTAVRPVVLLHGFAQGATSWESIASQLCANRSVFALDFVGHGSSDKPSSGQFYALESQTQMLQSFLTHVADEAAIPFVVGYSMGGRIALAMAMQNASVLAGLVLESTGLGPATKAEQLLALDRDSRCAVRLRAEGLAAFMDDWQQLPLFASQKNLPAKVQERVRSERISNYEEALALTFEGAGQHCMPERTRVLDAVRAFDFPLLYLAGSLDSKYVSLAATFSDLPHVAVQVISGAGHNTHLEKPDEFVVALEACLENWENN